MLCGLNDIQTRMSIGNVSLNNSAYVDDVNLLATTIPGLQDLINYCNTYAKKWRFSFGLQKTNCIVIDKAITWVDPLWMLDNNRINITNSMTILGVTYNANGTFQEHVSNKISACRKCMYIFQEVGMSYSVLSTSVKSYLWNTMG